MMWIFIALLSGALMSIQGVFNTEVTKQTSLWVSTGWVQFSALAVCIIAWFFTSLYHRHSHPEHGQTGPGAGNAANRNRTAGNFLPGRTIRTVRSGKAAAGVAEADRDGGGCGRNHTL